MIKNIFAIPFGVPAHKEQQSCNHGGFVVDTGSVNVTDEYTVNAGAMQRTTVSSKTRDCTLADSP
eukprot:428636-Amphidinium_carterae.1